MYAGTHQPVQPQQLPLEDAAAEVELGPGPHEPREAPDARLQPARHQVPEKKKKKNNARNVVPRTYLTSFRSVVAGSTALLLNVNNEMMV